MDQLIEMLLHNENSNVKLSWTQFAAFTRRVGMFGVQGIQGTIGFLGLQGRMGLEGTGKKTRTVPRTKMPETLCFTIEFVDSKLLFQEFCTLLDRIVPNVDQKVEVLKVPGTPIPRPKRVKQEFVAVGKQLDKIFDEKQNFIHAAMKSLFELGLKLDENYYVERTENLPAEAYEEFGEQKETNSVVRITCSENSEIYKALDFAGLLQKYCPEDYRRGDPYSVNGGPLHVQPTEEVNE